MKRSFDASFHPGTAVDAGAARQYPTWFILDRGARYANCDNNATTASAITSAGRTIKFTLCLAPPPALSHLFVHETDTHLAVDAVVVSSAKDLVLLHRIRDKEVQEDEFFVYQPAAAGRGRSKPSLRPIPANHLTTLSWRAAILPLDDGEFLLADLTVDYSDMECHYNLHVFSSKTCVWSTRALTLPIRPSVLDTPEAVITLGGSVLGWVVHETGIVVCDVLFQEPFHDRFIPLPKPDWDPSVEWRAPLLLLRDVAYCGDGFIRVLDIDLRFQRVTVHDDDDDDDRRVRKMTKDFDHVDTIPDSELLLPDTWTKTVPDGWKIRTCYKHISWNYWRKGHFVDSEDITIYNPAHCATLPELWDEDTGRWTLKKLKVSETTLRIYGDNVVYLTIVLREGDDDEQKWIVGLDLGKRTVEMLERDHNSQSCVQPFTFSQHLNIPPSVEEIVHATSGARSNHASSACATQNNNLQQNMWNADAYYNGSSYGYVDDTHQGNGYGNNQHPPTWSANFPQALHHNFNSSGSGCVYPVNGQSMYPLHMVNTATHGQQFHSMPLLPPRPAVASARSSLFAPPWRPGQMAYRR